MSLLPDSLVSGISRRDCLPFAASIFNLFCRAKPKSIRGPEKMVRKVLLVIALVVVVLSVVGCKTVQGIGGDITWVGKKGQQVVER